MATNGVTRLVVSDDTRNGLILLLVELVIAIDALDAGILTLASRDNADPEIKILAFLSHGAVDAVSAFGAAFNALIEGGERNA
jgi:hypothetical protein